MNASRAAGWLVVVLLSASPRVHATHTNSDTGSIAGKVVDGTTHSPIAGATVKLGREGRDGCDSCFPSTDVPNVLTGPDGRFAFGSLPAGVYVVRAARPGYPIGAFGVRRPSGEPASIQVLEGARVDGLTIPLFRRAVVSGTITDRDGEPVVDRMVSFLRRIPGTDIFDREGIDGGDRGAWSPVSNARTDDRGNYVAQVPAGEFVVLLRIGPDQFPSTAPSDAGQAVVPVPTFYPGVTSYQSAVAIDLKPGEERPGVSFSAQTAPTGSLKGRVPGFDAKADWVFVTLRSVAVPDPAQPEVTRQQSFDGTFTFNAVPAGEYLLDVIQSNHRVPGLPESQLALRSSMQTVIRSGESTDVTIQVRPQTLVSGTVASEGLPAGRRQEVRVWLAGAEDPRGCGAAPWHAEKVEGGHFAVPAPGPGRYRVCATPSGLPVLGLATLGGQDVVDAPLTVGESDITGVVIAFGACASGLAGSVRDERGSLAREGWVIAFPVDRRLWTQAPVGGPRFVAARVSLGGTYQIAGLVEGEYFVVSVTDDVMAAWPSVKFFEAMAGRAGRVAVPRDRALAMDLTIGR